MDGDSGAVQLGLIVVYFPSCTVSEGCSVQSKQKTVFGFGTGLLHAVLLSIGVPQADGGEGLTDVRLRPTV